LLLQEVQIRLAIQHAKLSSMSTSIEDYSNSTSSNERKRRDDDDGMLNLMVVPIVNAVDTYYVGQFADPFALATQSAPINVSS